MTPAALAFVLFSVTYNGQTSSSYYQTEHDCLEAAHLAQYGDTVEQEQVREKALADADAKFRAEHPPRPPIGVDERRIAVSGLAGLCEETTEPTSSPSLSVTLSRDVEICNAGNGMVQEMAPQTTTFGIVQPGDIKSAQCFQSLEDSKR